MANCTKLFDEFNENISLNASKKSKMTASKEALRKRIVKYFKENHPKYEPKFYIQGSYKMKTGIRTYEDICDLDDGVYFFREPDVTSTTLQTWVKDAVDGFTGTPAEHRSKCIRTTFKGDYEVDMPVYYSTDEKNYYLAVKNVGWEASDPKAMVDWVNKQKDKEGRYVKNIKFLKAWCDNKGPGMPSGLAMTILAADAKSQIIYGERHDINLRDTLKEIQKALDKDFKCVVPVVPEDNLFENYKPERKQDIKDKLSKFIEDADKALKEKNQLQASKLWKRHLGDWFPEGEDKDEEESAKAKSAFVGAGSSKPWS